MEEVIARILRQAGIDAYGFCAFCPEYLLSCRAASRLPKEAKSVIVVLFPYAFCDSRPRNISRYAAVPDYHEAAGNVLKSVSAQISETFGAPCEPFMDNSPLPEVSCAVAAGLGVRGDNGLLIHPKYGSYVFIGCMVTPLPLSPAVVGRTECLHCGACARVCPGKCLPGSDRTSCLSAITQKKGALSPGEQALLYKGGSAWGCDRCQEVCPMNTGVTACPHPCFSGYEPWLSEQSLSDLRHKAYGWRGAETVRRNLHLLKEGLP